MGWGDALMAAGQAQELYAQDPSLGPILMTEGDSGPRWNPVWQGNPAIWVPIPNAPVPPRQLRTGKGYLPYLRSPYSLDSGWTFTDWRACEHRGRLYLTIKERARGTALALRLGRYVILEPTAARKHPNRRPPVTFWDDVRLHLKAQLGNPPIVQLMHPGATYHHGTIPVVHESFREACGILAGAALLVTTEGGLAHAAAALGVPAVVLWGGMISARALGYPEHVNVVDPSPESPCGRLRECLHCRAAWAALDPADVARLAAAQCGQVG
jgi:hypothetical protein